jgi:hypothetical protein
MPKLIATASGVLSPQYEVAVLVLFHFYNATAAKTRRPIFMPNTSTKAVCSKDVFSWSL